MDLSITNVMTVSIAEVPTGLANANTSVLALFTRDEPGESFGEGSYKVYREPTSGETDFGTDSATAKMIQSVFSQKKNILTGKGYMVVIPLLAATDPIVAVQHIAFSEVPAAGGSYKLKYGANSTGAINSNSNAATVQSALRLLAGLGTVTVAGDETDGFDVTFTGVAGPATLLEATHVDLQTAVPENVELTIATTTIGVSATGGETMEEAIVRTQGLVQYFATMAAEITATDAMSFAAAEIESLNKLAFWVSRTAADVEPGGAIDLFRSRNQHQNRGLFYGSDSDIDALKYMAAYAGRALSTNFSGVKTAQTMHLKDLTNIDPDPSMDETLAQKCKDAGADIYASIQGVSKTLTSGKNHFFDQAYNSLWFKGAIEIAGFNALAETDTKVPQTEEGVSTLSSAYQDVCEQAATCNYIAPGEWQGAIPFGDPETFLRNIQEKGYYIYSQPISQQVQAERAAREAPLVQIAVKESGAQHSGQVIIYINS